MRREEDRKEKKGKEGNNADEKRMGGKGKEEKIENEKKIKEKNYLEEKGRGGKKAVKIKKERREKERQE